jgi:hypothetical protein
MPSGRPPAVARYETEDLRGICRTGCPPVCPEGALSLLEGSVASRIRSSFGRKRGMFLWELRGGGTRPARKIVPGRMECRDADTRKKRRDGRRSSPRAATPSARGVASGAGRPRPDCATVGVPLRRPKGAYNQVGDESARPPHGRGARQVGRRAERPRHRQESRGVAVARVSPLRNPLRQTFRSHSVDLSCEGWYSCGRITSDSVPAFLAPPSSGPGIFRPIKRQTHRPR